MTIFKQCVVYKGWVEKRMARNGYNFKDGHFWYAISE